jgi:hypothetical protein
MYQFQNLLEKAPRHYHALSQLVVLLRRAGRLEAIPNYFQIAESSHPKAFMDPGLHYCKGLHHWCATPSGPCPCWTNITLAQAAATVVDAMLQTGPSFVAGTTEFHTWNTSACACRGGPWSTRNCRLQDYPGCAAFV